MDVVPGVALVALHHRELGAVDQQRLFECQAEGLGNQHADLDQGHAPVAIPLKIPKARARMASACVDVVASFGERLTPFARSA
ncbi:MAG: hypothetical protein QM674_08300 [Burkholderiaceae bacterium]